MPEANQRGVGYQFPVPPNSVTETGSAPGYTGEPNVVIIRVGEVAECNYMMWGGQQSYANLVIQGTLIWVGGWYRLRPANRILDKLE